MSEGNKNPFSVGQIDADLFVAKATIDKADSLSSKVGKYYRGLAGYHLQQATEKIIKYQIYESKVQVDNTKMYKHSLDKLLAYATSKGISIEVPKWIDDRKLIISSWEAEGRYDVHFVVRLDTLKKCYDELISWRNELFPQSAIKRK